MGMEQKAAEGAPWAWLLIGHIAQAGWPSGLPSCHLCCRVAAHRAPSIGTCSGLSCLGVPVGAEGAA